MRLDFQIVCSIIILLAAIEMTFALKSPVRSVRQRQLRVKHMKDLCPICDDSGRDQKLSMRMKRRNRSRSVDGQHMCSKSVFSPNGYPSVDESIRDRKLQAMIMRTNRSDGVRQHPLRTKRLLDETDCFGDSRKDDQNAMANIRSAKDYAAGLASKAALEAKQANDDMASAVKAASDRIKQEYAEKAAMAAKAAEAVLVSKKQLMQQLEMEVSEAELVVQEETQELSAMEAQSQLALRTHTESKEQLNLLINGIKLARENLINSEMVAAACQQSMMDRNALLQTAQKRLKLLHTNLAEARADLAKTKKAADNAMYAAKVAKQRILTKDETNCSK